MSSAALEAQFSAFVERGGSRFTLDVDFRFDGRVLVLFGPSGAGKSLTLRALAGLLKPQHGRIAIKDTTFYDSSLSVWLPPHRRRLGYVPQHQSLFPFLDVAGNVGFGLRGGRGGRGRVGRAIVDQLLEELGIAHLASARPGSLSGGERQRVALARALAPQPRLLLLDEPFAAVDQVGRKALQELLRETLEHHQVPAVFVTHDSTEAAALADQVVVIEEGHSRPVSEVSQAFGASPDLGVSAD
jgi:molybdate transport system ATP-binding protein